MENEPNVKLDPKIFSALNKKFNGDREKIKNFVNDSVQEKLNETLNDPPSTEGLEDFLKSGPQGSRAYGVKGQGW